jgi:uncharacterized protein (TIGR03435 family)
MTQTSIIQTAAAVLLAAVSGFAQPAPVAFEVASVKPAAPITSKEGKMRVGLTVSGNRVEIHYTALAELVRIAYQVKSYQVTGPDWTESARYDVQAVMPAEATQDQMPEMLKALLAERFKLTLRHDSKEFPVYALELGKGGLKLAEVEPDETMPPVKAAAVAKKMAAADGKGSSDGGVHLDRKMTMPALAEFLGRFVDRPVVDKTETKGTFQVAMDIPMTDLMKAKVGAERRAAGDAGGQGTASEPAISGVFGIVQKLGLKLEPRKEPAELLVIEKAEKEPTGN